jgi:anti-sigma regulatory factor (Ser/Thr protein kinase)
VKPPGFGLDNAIHLCEAFVMSEMRSLNGPSGPQSQFTGKRSFSSALEIDSWMPSRPEAISPLLNRLMLLIEGSQCVPGEEFAVELALREALRNAVVHGNQERPKAKVHIRCRCWPGKAISIVVTAQGKEFDFGNSRDNGLLADPISENQRGIQLIKAYMDDVYFERDGSEVHMCKRSRITARS